MAFPQPKLYNVQTTDPAIINSMLANAAQIGVFCWSGLTKGVYFHTTKGKALFIYKQWADQVRVVTQEMNRAAFDKWYRENFMAGNTRK